MKLWSWTLDLMIYEAECCKTNNTEFLSFCCKQPDDHLSTCLLICNISLPLIFICLYCSRCGMEVNTLFDLFTYNISAHLKSAYGANYVFNQRIRGCLQDLKECGMLLRKRLLMLVRKRRCILLSVN